MLDPEIITKLDVADRRFWIAVAIAIGGIILTAVIAYIQNRQKNRLQKELETLKTTLDEKLLIRKIQFEKEFQTYIDLWEPLAKLVVTAKDLRPKYRHGLHQKKIDERLDEVNDLCQKYMDSYFYSRPYMPETIFMNCQYLKDCVIKEWLEVAATHNIRDTNNATRNKYYEKAGEFADRITKAGDDLCAMIRCRLHVKDIHMTIASKEPIST